MWRQSKNFHNLIWSFSSRNSHWPCRSYLWHLISGSYVKSCSIMTIGNLSTFSNTNFSCWFRPGICSSTIKNTDPYNLWWKSLIQVWRNHILAANLSLATFSDFSRGRHKLLCLLAHQKRPVTKMQILRSQSYLENKCMCYSLVPETWIWKKFSLNNAVNYFYTI